MSANDASVSAEDPGLLERFGNDAVFLAEMRQLFCRTTLIELDGLWAALKANDAVVAERLAISLRGAASIMGATALAWSAQNIASTAKAGDLAAARVLFTQLETAFARFRNEVEAGEAAI